MKIAFAVLLAAIVIKLWPIILMLVIAVLLAVMLDPIVLWLEAHRVRRPFGIAAVASVLLGLLIAFLFILVPVISGQIADLIKELPQVIDRISRAVPEPFITLIAFVHSQAVQHATIMPHPAYILQRVCSSGA